MLVGPSGCGKTTSLRMINRLDEASAGTIAIDGVDIRQHPVTELRRGIGYVMQHSGLFPHRTIGDNIATVPRLLGWNRKCVAARVDDLIETVGLERDMAARYPHQLSGGQQQRVGVALALAADPPIMLMDEPFAAVDPDRTQAPAGRVPGAAGNVSARPSCSLLTTSTKRSVSAIGSRCSARAGGLPSSPRRMNCWPRRKAIRGRLSWAPNRS